MKTFKILFAALIIAGFATTANANDQDTEVSASAFVLDQLEVEKDTDVDFGNVSQGITAILNVADGTTTDAGANAVFGKLDITGSEDANLFISFPALVLLEGPGADLEYSPALKFSLSDDIEDAGQTVTAAGSVHLLDEVTEAFVHIGGSLEVPAAQAVGAYAGTFDVTIVYN